MEKLIKTENVNDFINEYFIEHRSRLRRFKDDLTKSLGIGYAAIQTPLIPKDHLEDEVLISNESGLKEGDSLKFENKEYLNSRCRITHHYSYSIKKYDSVSVKGILESYSIEPIYNK